MISTVVRADGTLGLGSEARAVGYRPGALVDVVVLSSGSVLVVLSDRVPLPGEYEPLPMHGNALRAIGGRRP